MRSRLVLATLATLVVAAPLAGSAERRSGPPRLDRVRSWAFAIGDGAAARDLSRYDLVVVDAQETSRQRVAALRKQGAIVLGYLSVGTIERGRPWFDAAAPFRLELWEDWGEWYADTSQPGFRRLITGRVAPAILAKGFDGLFLDNVDMVETHSRQAAGMRLLVRSLSRQVRARNGVLFAQNGDGVIGQFVRWLDGWNREDVSSTFDFDGNRYAAQPEDATRAAQASLRRIKNAGVFVTATDYVAAGDASETQRAQRNACAAGALPFVSDIELRRVPPIPASCKR